jgi:Flp pilus assembly protein TadD
MRKTMLFVCALFIFAIAIPFAFAQVASIEEEKSSAGNEATSEPSTELVDPRKNAEQALTEGKYEDAVLAMRKTVESDPENPESYTGLGLACYHAGHFEEAISAFQKALTLKRITVDQSFDLYLCLGIVYDAMGDSEKAKEEISKCLNGSRKDLQLGEALVAETLLKQIGNK